MRIYAFVGAAPGLLKTRPPQRLKKTIRLTALLVAFACIQASALAYSQTINFSGTNVPLQTVFAAIEKQTGLSFFFNASLLKDAKPVTMEVKNASVEETMKVALEGQGLEFYQSGKTIFIVKGKPKVSVESSRLTLNAGNDGLSLKGRVTDEQGLPLAGASVYIKGGSKGTVTDERGMFELKGVSSGAVLVVTYAGYKGQQIAVNGNEPVQVKLALSNDQLDAPQVIAYGNTTQRLATGNTTTIKGEDIAKQPVANPILALEGRVPGLFITQSTGFAGSAVAVLIEGRNSVASGTQPLYLVDGVPYPSDLLPNLGGILGHGLGNQTSGSPFSFLNPADIESISVLKDADATAIYGSRAANGAILIVTRKGKAGVTRVDLNAQEGVGEVARRVDLLNTQQYVQMRRQAIANDINVVGPTDYDINGLWDTNRYTDWQKKLIGGHAQYSTFNGTVSGGTANTQFLIGGTFHRETTVFPGDFSDGKGTLHFSINNVSGNQKFRIQLVGSYQLDDNHLPANDLTVQALQLAPDAPALYNSDGSLNWAPDANGSSSWTNPLAMNYTVYHNKTTSLTSGGLLSYQLLPVLELRANLGYTNLQSNETYIQPLLSTQPELRATSINGAIFGYNNINSWIVEPQLTFKKIFWRGKLEALAGYTLQQRNSKGDQLVGIGYSSDAQLTDVSSAAVIFPSTPSTAIVYKYSAFFGRINYNWQDKYILDITGRRDGSSRFGAANQFQNFGAVAGAWIFSSEPIFHRILSFISFGKLRASYGTTGNDQISDYQFLSTYTAVPNVSVAYQGATGLGPNGLANPYLQWELTKKLQFGLDLGFAKDRVLLHINYNRNRSSNELLSYALPSLTGFQSITRNFPATVQNTGWEFSLVSTNIRVRDFTWQTSLNLTLPKNKLLSFPNLATSSYADNYIIGKPITIFKSYHFLGVDPATGKYVFSDSHGNGTSTPNASTDMITMVNGYPDYYGGLDNSFSYKGFQLDVFFQFVKEKGLTYRFGPLDARTPGTFGLNEPAAILGNWQKPGDVSSLQRYSANRSLSIQNSDVQLSDAARAADASFVRLKNVSISWTIPAGWQKKLHIQNGQIYLQGQNLLTITKYIGLDPESLSSSTLPPLRIFTAGIRVGL